jgi:hypothetical protein
MRGLPAHALAPLPRGLSVTLCVGLLATVAVVDRSLIGLTPVVPHPRALELGVALDLTVVSALLAWWMLRRELGWSVGALIPLFFGSLLTARLALPPQFESILRPMDLLAVPLELLALGWLMVKAHAARKAWVEAGCHGLQDAGDRLNDSAREALGPGRLTDVFATELTVLRYSLLSWREPAPAESGTLSYHRRSAYGAIVVAVILASAAEIPAMHLLLGLWSKPVAWVFTALGIYGVLWVVGDWRACRLRPVRVEHGTLRIRFGLRWRVDVPMGHILTVRAATGAERAQRRSVDLRLALPGTAWTRIELDHPVTAVGMYGLRRRVRTLGLGVDDPERLGAALEPFRAARPRPATEHTDDERT